MISSNRISGDEYNRLGLSNYRWANNKQKQLPRRNIKRGSVFQFDFGMNSVPEMSYEHRGIVIGLRNNLLYVLPVFTYQANKHQKDLFDPINNRNGNLYRIDPADHPFIKHASIIKLDDIRCVSVSRIVYSHNYRMDIQSDEYKTIERAALSNIFPQYDYLLKTLEKENAFLKYKIKQLEDPLEM